jgi:DNA excision repair protein ERCC-4
MPKPVHSIVIQADIREERSGIPTILAQKPGVELHMLPLPIGDYLLGGSPERVVERKTGNDFVSSVVDHRLFAQLDALAAAENISPLLILEGDPTGTQSRINVNAIYGALTYCTSILRIPILPSKGPGETAELLVSIARQVQVKFQLPGPAPTKRAATLAEQQKNVLMSLPGIGPVTAQALLERFGSVRAVAVASPEALTAVSGVTLERATLLVKILQAPAEQTIVLPEQETGA